MSKIRKTHRYPDLTKGGKALVFGLNGAKLFYVYVESKRKDLPTDCHSHIKMAYLDEGPSPSHQVYGWIER